MACNLHIYQSCFIYDGRILRETEGIVRSGRAEFIYLVGLGRPPLREFERLDARRTIWRVPMRAHHYIRHIRLPWVRGLAFYAEWYASILRRFRHEDVRVVHCYSLEALPVGAILKRAHRARLVYEPLELETEREWLVGLRKLVWKRIEACFIRRADAVAVVSQSIARWYRRTYPVLDRIAVVRSIPVRGDKAPPRSRLLKEKLGLGAEDVLFIYQGGLTAGRGIERLLEVFRRTPMKHIVFLGYGPLEGHIRRHATRYSNIHFHKAVAPTDLLRYTASADVGIHILPNTCLNAYYCLPNKIFEYLHAGLPVAVSAFPELAAVVDEFGCGWKLSGGTEEILRFVTDLSWGEIRVRSEAALRARQHLGWEDEEKTLFAIYDDLLGNTGGLKTSRSCS